MNNDYKKEMINDTYEEFLKINLISEFYPKKRQYTFDYISNHRERFIKENVDAGSVVIGVEQLPEKWSMPEKIRFMAEYAKNMPQISFAVPDNQYKEYESAIFAEIDDMVGLYDEIDHMYKDDYLIRIIDQRIFMNISYIKLYNDGLIRIVCEDTNGKLHKKEMQAPPGLLHNAHLYAKKYVEDVNSKVERFAEDDRCFLKGFKMNCGFNVFGYKEEDYPESGLYFYTRTKSAIINDLLQYYIEFAKDADEIYLLLERKRSE